MNKNIDQTGPIMPSLESLRTLRQQKYNPLRHFTPDKLVRALEAFEIGNLREFAMLAETIAERDDTLKSVKPKREKEVSQLERQVLARPNSGDAGEEHREILEDFWNNVRVVNAFDRNERGGFRRLVKQMMTSVSYRYAAHHIVWDPRHGRLRATFEFVPLWLFENRTGTLRYLEGFNSTDGVPLDPAQWMLTHGDGLMIACSIGYSAKRNAFNDWLIFSEKFSVPGLLGRTSAKKDSEEGRMMRDAVESFGHDWVGVLYGDDGTHENPIELIQAQGNPNGMPMPAVVERVDRKFAALYRGADLSTMSARDGEGTGASLQGKEKDILLADDAETINETLAEVSRMVIEWHFGAGTEPLAEVLLIAPSDDDEKFYLESVEAAVKMGVRVAKGAFLARLGIQEANKGELALGESEINEPKVESRKSEDEVNALHLEEETALQELRMVLADDLQPLGDALFAAANAGDVAAMKAAAKKISERMPDFLENEALTGWLEEQMLDALEGTEEEANVFNPLQPRDLFGRWTDGQSGGGGSDWKNRPKGSGKPKKGIRLDKIEEVVQAAYLNSDNRDFADYGEVTAMESARFSQGAPFDTTGWIRRVSADTVNKILSKHSTDQFPVTEEDFRKLPEIHKQTVDGKWEQMRSGEWRLKSVAKHGRDLWIIEQAFTGRKVMNLISMYRP